ncbi:hypothetical protein [Paraclostridium bifermentans]|uniref:hypothetical protein n=1 Tax=Paraclostridium bifermentans TaxID=1490 RepID=UPI0022E0AB94|nr:hypothetical protein [Paraclostridium bifermentans]
MCFKNNDFSNLEIKNIKGKEIYIVDDHNCVFPIWLHKSRENNVSYRLITFDYHTDTQPAFLQYSSRVVGNDGMDDKINRARNIRDEIENEIERSTIENVVDIVNTKLAYDEHIKLAYDLDVISEFHVINCSGEFTDQDGYYYKNKNIHRNNRLSDRYIRDMNFNIPSTPYILDFDLDYFNSNASLEPDDKSVISDLIRNCEFITIAREAHHFDKLKEDDFTAKDAENKLIDLIESVL